jgi:hypothetical protein
MQTLTPAPRWVGKNLMERRKKEGREVYIHTEANQRRRVIVSFDKSRHVRCVDNKHKEQESREIEPHTQNIDIAVHIFEAYDMGQFFLIDYAICSKPWRHTPLHLV